jgi:hypothetical protein
MYGMHAYLSKYDKGIYPEFTSVCCPLSALCASLQAVGPGAGL